MNPPKPNILFVFPDQFRLQALGFRDEDPVHTPNLNRFAEESCVLTHAVSTRPVCSPYRAMLLTGMFPHKNDVVANCNSNTSSRGNYLKEETVCFSDLLAEAGYSQGYIGKWHLDPPNPEHNAYTEGPARKRRRLGHLHTPQPKTPVRLLAQLRMLRPALRPALLDNRRPARRTDKPQRMVRPARNRRRRRLHPKRQRRAQPAKAVLARHLPQPAPPAVPPGPVRPPRPVRADAA